MTTQNYIPAFDAICEQHIVYKGIRVYTSKPQVYVNTQPPRKRERSIQHKGTGTHKHTRAQYAIKLKRKELHLQL